MSPDIEKRLFFGFEVEAPWPETLPGGRLIQEGQRHMTVAFLGQTDFSKLKQILSDFPPLPFNIGVVGFFDKCVFLPKNHPRVAAWHIHWLDECEPLEFFQKELIKWLKSFGFNPEDRKNFLPHVTICRSPFVTQDWKKEFKQLPCFIRKLNLYESMGQLNYQSIWSHPFEAKPPFEEIEHTADIAFRIFGKDIQELYHHAFIALAFKFPPLVKFYLKIDNIKSVDDIVIHLNQITSNADGEISCPFKAISFHGEAVKVEETGLVWEMIVDV